VKLPRRLKKSYKKFLHGGSKFTAGDTFRLVAMMRDSYSCCSYVESTVQRMVDLCVPSLVVVQDGMIALSNMISSGELNVHK